VVINGSNPGFWSGFQIETFWELRIEDDGVFYQITCRGKQREKIFWDAKDRERLKAILERTKERYGYVLHAHVFMDNHVLY